MFVEGYDAAILGIVERDGFLVVVHGGFLGGCG